jgi:F420-0:gamma-glutamyl ligase
MARISRPMAAEGTEVIFGAVLVNAGVDLSNPARHILLSTDNIYVNLRC